MDSYNSLEQLPDSLGPSAVTLGNFDGVHLGHRELFRKLINKSRQHNCASVVFTFAPHPLKLLAPERAPLLLSTTEEKRCLIAASQIDLLIEAPFTQEFAQMTPEQFVDDVLIKRLQIKALIVGYDYAFGRGRCGNTDFLKQSGRDKGFDVEVLPPVGGNGLAFSSTRTRQMIAAGQVAEVVSLLGRQYSLEGQVIQEPPRRGALGYVMVKLKTTKEQLPAPGFYAVKVRHGQQEFNAVVSVGQRASVGAGESNIEVHLIDFVGRVCEESLRIFFIERLAGESRTARIKDLAEEMACDVPHFHQQMEPERSVTAREFFSL